MSKKEGQDVNATRSESLDLICISHSTVVNNCDTTIIFKVNNIYTFANPVYFLFLRLDALFLCIFSCNLHTIICSKYRHVGKDIMVNMYCIPHISFLFACSLQSNVVKLSIRQQFKRFDCLLSKDAKINKFAHLVTIIHSNLAAMVI